MTVASLSGGKDSTAMLLRLLEEFDGQSGIVYCMTRKAVDAVCELLERRGISAAKYHAGMEDDARRAAQDDRTASHA